MHAAGKKRADIDKKLLGGGIFSLSSSLSYLKDKKLGPKDWVSFQFFLMKQALVCVQNCVVYNAVNGFFNQKKNLFFQKKSFFSDYAAPSYHPVSPQQGSEVFEGGVACRFLTV